MPITSFISSRGLQLKAIELLKGSLDLPAGQHGITITNFSFTIDIENNADPVAKLVFIIVHVIISSTDRNQQVGSLSVSCIFTITDFDEVISKKDDQLVIPDYLIDVFNSISLSTTRGVMFSTFKGTYLHNAILPIVDPGQFASL